MNVVRAEVEGDETLEDDGASWVGSSQEAEQASGGASICDHVEDGSELC